MKRLRHTHRAVVHRVRRRVLLGMLVALATTCATPDGRPDAPTLGAERVYVANTYGESLTVVDHATRSVATTVALRARPHGLVASSDGRRLYVTSSGGHGEVIAIDTTSHDILWRLDVGTSLHLAALTRTDDLLFAPDFARNVVAVVDVDARRVERVIEGGSRAPPLVGLHNAYTGAQGRYVYQTAIYSGAIARIDVAARTIDRIYSVDGHPRPAALLADESRMYVQLSDLHGFIELDLDSGVESRRIVWPMPAGTAYDEPLCHGIGISPDEAELWATSSIAREVRVYGLPTLTEEARIPLDDTPQWIAFSRDGQTAYVTLTTAGHKAGMLAVIDRATRRVVANLPVGPEPKRVHTVVVLPPSEPSAPDAVDPGQTPG